MRVRILQVGELLKYIEIYRNDGHTMLHRDKGETHSNLEDEKGGSTHRVSNRTVAVPPAVVLSSLNSRISQGHPWLRVNYCL